VVLVALVGYSTWRSKKVERWIEGRPKNSPRAAARSKDDVLGRSADLTSELMEALRHQGCTAVTNVRFAILENDGGSRPANEETDD